jgi:LacI family transcriptional regulator
VCANKKRRPVAGIAVNSYFYLKFTNLLNPLSTFSKNMRSRSHIIAMLVEDISDPFFSAIARIIEEEAHRHGYRIFYSSTGNDGAIAKDVLKVYRDARADAYIIAPPSGIDEEIAALTKEPHPVVLFDRYLPSLAGNRVIVDNHNGSVLAIKHLWMYGYRRVGFVTLDSEQTQMADRLSGYMDCTGKFNLPSLVLRIPFGTAPARATHEIGSFLREQAPDAVVFATHYLAVSGLRAITGLGLAIPDDIAVIGFDDSPYFTLCSPSVTAIAQPVQAIAQTIIRHLIPYLSGQAKCLPEETTVLPVNLIIRQSTVRRKASPAHK